MQTIYTDEEIAYFAGQYKNYPELQMDGISFETFMERPREYLRAIDYGHMPLTPDQAEIFSRLLELEQGARGVA